MKKLLNNQEMSKKNRGLWLITGGAGYIGSHISADFLRLGIPFNVIDINESKMVSRLSVDVHKDLADIRKIEDLDTIFSQNNFAGVIHLAALKSVEESQQYPSRYEQTNEIGTRNLLHVMKKYGVKNLVFSSTAAVYGETEFGILNESTKMLPISNYGKSKMICERIIEEANREFGLEFVNLRYFNVAGTLNDKLRDDSKDNLIPIVFDQITKGSSPNIFGGDYPTHDGTAIRDYIHVLDVSSAHVAAVDFLLRGGGSQTLNIGTGVGTSVLEIVSEIILQLGSNLAPNYTNRREGDVGKVVADPTKAEEILYFRAKRTLSEIVASLL
jgi:UDP-glucose 4-epimerase